MEQFNLPLVSVIVATYRQDNRLKRALESLIDQEYEQIEIIVIDDNNDLGWTKKVERIIEDIRKSAVQKQYTVRHIVNNNNMGSAETRNVGIREAKGEFVTFLDDDDFYLPYKVIHQVTAMMKENADFSLTDLNLLKDDDTLSEHRIRSYLVGAKREDLFELHMMHHMTGTDSLMFRKNYILKIGCFDGIDLGDEFYLMNKAILGDGVFCYVPICDINAYVHTGEVGLSSGRNKILCENQLYEFKKKHFMEISKKAKKYIIMRHYAVLAFAYLRMGKYGKFLKNGLMGFLRDPIGSCKLIISRKL